MRILFYSHLLHENLVLFTFITWESCSIHIYYMRILFCSPLFHVHVSLCSPLMHVILVLFDSIPCLCLVLFICVTCHSWSVHFCYMALLFCSPLLHVTIILFKSTVCNCLVLFTSLVCQSGSVHFYCISLSHFVHVYCTSLFCSVQLYYASSLHTISFTQVVTLAHKSVLSIRNPRITQIDYGRQFYLLMSLQQKIVKIRDAQGGITNK